MELAGHSIYLWGGFVTFVLFMLALDLGVFHRKAHEIQLREALVWSAVWIGLALLFNAAILLYWDKLQPPGGRYDSGEAAMAFLAGYLVEKALSIDNIFVFLMVFAYFQVPRQYQHRVLFYGIIGALVFRALFIALGAAILERFFWTTILFGLFLIFTGVKMALLGEREIHPERNPVIKLVRRIFPVTTEYHGQRFFLRREGQLWATPLLLTLVLVEVTDVIFAVDSIPAIFAITSDPFIVFTSNVFAILGLRSLFFAIDGLVKLFAYLKYGLAAILVFVGLKMLYNYAEKVLVPDWEKFPVALSLGVIALILGVSVVWSWLRPPVRPAPVLSSMPQPSE
jgi:tellurite resistance protein TerC